MTVPWLEIVSKAFETNVKATYALMQALNDDDLFRVINYESGFVIWEHIDHNTGRNLTNEEN